MLELPEAYSLARQLSETLRGKTVQSVEAAAAPHRFSWYTGDPAGYDAFLSGRTADDAAAWGGLVEWSLGEARLLFADGVNLRYHPVGTPVPPKHQLRVLFSDESSLVCTVAMYGGLYAYPAGQNDNPYYLVAREKPSPLTDRFDRAWFDGLLRGAKSSLSLKAFLATEQRIPGLGNGVLQDILWNARLHPKRKLETLGDTEQSALYDAVKATLRAMAEAGGRDTERDLYGRPGGYRTRLSKNTLAYPCPACGGGLRREAYLGGNIYVCPACQT